MNSVVALILGGVPVITYLAGRLHQKRGYPATAFLAVWCGSMLGSYLTVRYWL